MTLPGARRRAAVALALGALGLVAGVIPFGGLLGLAAIGLAVSDRGSPGRALRGLAIGLGAAGAATALGWAFVFCEAPRAAGPASCPRIASWDGARYHTDASLLASSLYPWSQALDVDRLPHLRQDGGQYRLRIVNDSEAVDHIDRLQLWLVDHAKGAEVLPTVGGGLVAVEGAERPLRAADSAGHDVLPLIAGADGRTLTGATARDAEDEPRESFIVEFSRSSNKNKKDHHRALLVLRAHGAPFAEEAFALYLAGMGRGMGPFMEAVKPDTDDDCACARRFLGEELDLLRLTLVVTVSPGSAHEVTYSIFPVSPSGVRAFVLPVELPAVKDEGGEDRVRLRIDSTPRFWEIDQIALAPDPGGEVKPLSLSPRSAALLGGGGPKDVRELITAGDRRRAAIHRGEVIEVVFDAPEGPASGEERSAFAAMWGYYQAPIGGRRFVNAAAVLSHRWGLRSLPRFAAGLP